jgi:hypothetical protein
MEDLDFAMFNNYLQNEGKETGVFARFFDKWVKTGNVQENGLPEYKERCYVEIKVKNSTDAPIRPADESDIRRFPQQYAFYKAKKEKQKDGTPLNQFAFLSLPQLEACDMRGITTIEELAALDDDKVKALNLTDAKELAMRFLDLAKNNQALAQMEAENKALRSEIETLKEENKALKEATK